MYGRPYNTRSRARAAQQNPFARPPPPGAARGRRQQDASGYILYTLLSAIYTRISQLERPVPVTCALLGLNIVAHYLPEAFLPFGVNIVELGAVCLQPARIVKLMVPGPSSSSSSSSGSYWDDWLSSFMSFGQRVPASLGLASASASARWQEAASRVWLSAIVHGDDMHLYLNMMSLLYKGVNLEMRQGSLPFAALVLFSWLVSHALIFVAALGLHTLGFDGSYYSCAVGFSAVIFALKYVLNATSDGWVDLQGIPIPVGWACWAELFLTSLISPNASFLGHLCGILAGVLWLDAAWLLRLGKRLYASAISLFTGLAPGRRYTYMRAPSGRRQPQQAGVPAPSAPPAAHAHTGNGHGHGHGAGGGLGAAEERLLQEAIRRSLEEQGQQQQQHGQAQHAGGGHNDLYRPSAPYVPTATVVSQEAGPRLPTYDEAVGQRPKRR